MSKKGGPNRENLAATRQIFLNIAKREFSTKGYYATSTNDIVEESGMARGSLYYHFGDKKGLFKAVYEITMLEICDIMINTANKTDAPWEKFVAVCHSLLDVCTRTELRRIIVDVHTALTYRERYEILATTVLKEFLSLVSEVIKAGYFKGHDPRTLTMIVFGIISESGRSLEIADNVQKTRTELGDTLSLFLEKAAA